MESPSVIALSRQLTLRRELDAIANNVANVNTPSFKGERMMFVEHLVEPQKDTPMSFVRDFGMVRDLNEGPLTKTENPLDLAIIGEAYFTVQTENGPRYTRAGRFQLDANRQIANQQGLPVLGDGGQGITVPPDSGKVTVSSDGTVSAGDAVLGKIGLVKFENPLEMKREGNNLFKAEEPPQPADDARIVQGSLEESNVNAVLEMTRMIQVHRTYTSNQRLLTDEHERMRRAISRITAAPSRV